MGKGEKVSQGKEMGREIRSEIMGGTGCGRESQGVEDREREGRNREGKMGGAQREGEEETKTMGEGKRQPAFGAQAGGQPAVSPVLSLPHTIQLVLAQVRLRDSRMEEERGLEDSLPL